MDEKKRNESGAELSDEQLNEAAGGLFAPRKPEGPDGMPGDVLPDIKLPKKPLETPGGGSSGPVMPPVR